MLRALPGSIAALGLVLSGCTLDGGQAAPGEPISSASSSPPDKGVSRDRTNTPAPSTSPSPSLPQEKAMIEEAKTHAAGYDYTAALDILEPLKSAQAKKLARQYTADQDELTIWQDNSTISHLFFHSLVVDTERAFDGDGKEAGYDDYMITIGEFKKILHQLYDRNYILVSPHDIAEPDAAGKMQYTDIKLPKAKKPLVLSLDDLSYYEYMQDDGFATNLVVTEDGVTNTYTDAHGKTTTGSYDVVPILDDFVEEHPDFSYHGRKGVVALTGYNGIFGYRTSQREYGNDPELENNQQKAKRVAEAMKADGWEFASHTWGHIDLTNDPLSKIEADATRWNNEVKPLIGQTDMLIYPFGADISGMPYYSGPKYDLLKSQGYEYFFNVDGTAQYWHQKQGHYLRQARMNVDGIRLKANVDGHETSLDPFFDSKSVIDPARP